MWYSPRSRAIASRAGGDRDSRLYVDMFFALFEVFRRLMGEHIVLRARVDNVLTWRGRTLEVLRRTVLVHEELLLWLRSRLPRSWRGDFQAGVGS